MTTGLRIRARWAIGVLDQEIARLDHVIDQREAELAELLRARGACEAERDRLARPTSEIHVERAP